MRALVIGGSGQVGAALLHALRARGHHAVGTWAHHELPGLMPLDFTDAGAVERAIGESRPDWVLCPAALSHVDYCEWYLREQPTGPRGPQIDVATARGALLQTRSPRHGHGIALPQAA